MADSDENANDNGDLAEGPLSNRELKQIRRIIRDEDRSRWFWKEMRRWGSYGSIALGAIYASWEMISRIPGAIAHLLRGSP